MHAAKLRRRRRWRPRPATKQPSSRRPRTQALRSCEKLCSNNSDRANRLEQDLAVARHEVATQTALATKADDEATQLRKTADVGTADLRKALQQQSDRASRLEQDLAAARREVTTQTALATKVGAEATMLRKTADSDATDLRKALRQQSDRASQLEQDLAAARREAATQTATAAKTGDRLKQGIESSAWQLRQSLRPEQAAARPERDPPLTRRKENARTPAVAVVDESSRQREAEATAALVARANVLLDRGDVSSARIVLERAAEAGNAEASFRLAETYDPSILSKWGTYGTRGDATKALDLYARARAGGIKEAKERLDALRP